jgi:type I restriction enzyme M protein
MSKRHAAQGSQRLLLGRIEELVLASSGADAFELVFSLVASRLAAPRGSRLGRGQGATAKPRGRAAIARGLAEAERRWPGLEPSRSLDLPDEVLAAVEELLDRAALDGDAEALDAVFEQLTTRTGKGDKGQFFTPRHVVDWTVRSLLLAAGEEVVDPACGSGAFLEHARAAARVRTWGFDVDLRAVRVARLLAVASGDDPRRIARRDSLQRGAGAERRADVVVTNPPFAGDVRYAGYEVAALGRRAERDALFLERCVEMLRPGGRLAIVLPHNKVAARGWAGLRRWACERVRVLAVIGLPRETFLPHTSQKAAVVFAKRRPRPVAFEALDRSERIFFAVSERAGKDSAGEPIVSASVRSPRRSSRADAPRDEVTWRALDHDLDTLAGPLAAFLAEEGFAA